MMAREGRKWGENFLYSAISTTCMLITCIMCRAANFFTGTGGATGGSAGDAGGAGGAGGQSPSMDSLFSV